MNQKLKSHIEKEVSKYKRNQINRLLVSNMVSDIMPEIPKKVCDFLPAETGIGISHCGVTLEPEKKIHWIIYDKQSPHEGRKTA